jgi:hypothetical protein
MVQWRLQNGVAQVWQLVAPQWQMRNLWDKALPRADCYSTLHCLGQPMPPLVLIGKINAVVTPLVLQRQLVVVHLESSTCWTLFLLCQGYKVHVLWDWNNGTQATACTILLGCDSTVTGCVEDPEWRHRSLSCG